MDEDTETTSKTYSLVCRVSQRLPGTLLSFSCTHNNWSHGTGSAYTLALSTQEGLDLGRSHQRLETCSHLEQEELFSIHATSSSRACLLGGTLWIIILIRKQVDVAPTMQSTARG